ncbi:SM-20-related protein [Marinobacter nitratireducens]|uniref:SM-20-related protein n=1 Tax=Marinobacter nitratireducens TaxID=1137280 RepID=A0A072N414_9GAMM|nr:2OG-Fe(II) oxygenase [Marinobacter nitratireducens]KEF32251.1 SM-20-related protein [Marinobacter nitratireducens]
MDAQVVTPLHAGLPEGEPRSQNSTDVVDGCIDSIASALSEYGWLTLDAGELLGHALLRELAHEVRILDKTDNLKKAGVGRGSDHLKDRSVRRDKIAWLQGETVPQQALFSVLEELQRSLNRRLFLGLNRFEAHYATFHSGDFYRKHLDSFRGRASRVVSLVLYLNDDWNAGDGGALQVFNRDNDNEVCGVVTPEMGRMVVFLSEEVPHEVLPANRTRYSLACWFRQDEVPLPL